MEKQILSNIKNLSLVRLKLKGFLLSAEDNEAEMNNWRAVRWYKSARHSSGNEPYPLISTYESYFSAS